jgi:hypothetical protein
MEQSKIKTEPQEQQTAELRSWVTPTFEKVALNEALLHGGKAPEGIYFGS